MHGDSAKSFNRSYVGATAPITPALSLAVASGSGFGTGADSSSVSIVSDAADQPPDGSLDLGSSTSSAASPRLADGSDSSTEGYAAAVETVTAAVKTKPVYDPERERIEKELSEIRVFTLETRRYLHQNVIVRKSAIGGFGLFAEDDIKEGEVVWRAPKTPVHDIVKIYDLVAMEDRKKAMKFIHFGLQIGEDEIEGVWNFEQAVSDASLFHNHSCDPNCWFVGMDLVACKDIMKGEELTYDYGTSDSYAWPEELAGPMITCECKSPKCRGTVRPDDWKRKELRERYGDHWIPYILKMIRKDEEALESSTSSSSGSVEG